MTTTQEPDIAQLERELSKIKVQLLTKPDSVFFVTLAYSMRHVIDATIPTACTNGLRVRYNPHFLTSLTLEERIFLMLHEVMHIAYQHALRKMGRIHMIWNMACDYVINLQLVERGYHMPAVGLLDKAYAGKSAEEVYDILMQNPPLEIQGFGLDLGDLGDESGDDEDGNGNKTQTLPPQTNIDGTVMTQADVEREVKEILIRAALQSKMAGDKPGTVPGDIQIFVDSLLNPKLPYTRILSKYLTKYSRGDYSLQRPNRRFMPDHYLPSLYSTALIDLSIAIDASGSVSDDDFRQMVSDIAGIFRMMKPEKITLIQFDAVIQSIEEVKSIKELMKVKFHGRGGTRLEPVIDWAIEHKPQLLMVYTDGDFHSKNLEYRGDTLWLIHNNPSFKIHFGKVVHYEI